MEEALRQRFSPEFLGRLDKIVCFKPLAEQAVEGIAEKYLDQLRQRAEMGGMQLQFPQGLAGMLGKKFGNDGARNIRRLVQEKVESPLAAYLLSCTKKPTKIKASLKDDTLQFFG